MLLLLKFSSFFERLKLLLPIHRSKEIEEFQQKEQAARKRLETLLLGFNFPRLKRLFSSLGLLLFRNSLVPFERFASCTKIL